MKRYVEDGAVGFHTPGHKQGKGMDAEFFDLVTPLGLKTEVSLMEELDDLHEPAMCIKEAQDLAAELYNADSSYFVINGTTGAIHAMIMAAVNPGDKIIIPRNAHRSVIGGVILSGAEPIFVLPEVDIELGIAMAVSPEQIEQAIKEHPDAKAVLVVYPTYYGVASDIEKIASIVHKNKMLLLVDEAHGPHLKFSNYLPIQAIDAGADIVAQSTHKILGAMTQCSMLHARHHRIDVQKLKTMISLVQSTSPNYLLLASLDVARRQMAVEGKALLKRAVDLSIWLRNEINKIEGLYCFGEEKLGAQGAYALDITKLTVTVKGLYMTGAEAEKILRCKYKIQVELSDLYNILFILSYADGQREAETLLVALRKLAEEVKQNSTPINALACVIYPYKILTKQSPRQALFAVKREMQFHESAGCICGEMITFYPPGIPLICPGEVITQELIDYCKMMQQSGLKVVGPNDASLTTIQVVAE
ncbi:aminotransferase class I/II-fold pyridoxal phosphate-dependent enzyme [Anaerosinus gibii]|uniref:Aminotransferase class I/II-fold pyridoxal phosphate-dependent enzyme n=1 Tax=Selenobaculum gibii TaxID=3054208 RepID=A0A9Y2ETQ5_9FIRM|nr:aminotransferase class I/II-fold pyridoxal phosphate-dependent enzyme [Selenobaculum gbiensis]WIW71926.1 aminotransferase class I/II-fold pyridoxal phosphate-dependent enzyme [Selenobaculum gbiensis]